VSKYHNFTHKDHLRFIRSENENTSVEKTFYTLQKTQKSCLKDYHALQDLFRSIWNMIEMWVSVVRLKESNDIYISFDKIFSIGNEQIFVAVWIIFVTLNSRYS